MISMRQPMVLIEASLLALIGTLDIKTSLSLPSFHHKDDNTLKDTYFALMSTCLSLRAFPWDFNVGIHSDDAQPQSKDIILDSTMGSGICFPLNTLAI